MKTTKILVILVLALVLTVWPAETSEEAPTGTAFTCQGRLLDADSVADGLYDFQFRLFDDASTGTQQGGTVVANDVDVIDGYLMVELDFGSGAFAGSARWLEITIRPGASTGSFTKLSPRQELTATPYATYAKTAGSSPGGIGGSGTANYITKFTGTTTLGNSVIYQSGSNVGIGTTSPEDLLHLKSSGFPRLFVESTSSSAWAGVRAKTPRREYFMGIQTDSNRWCVHDNIANLERLTVAANGNVGIGTLIPAEKLHVAGDIRLNAGGDIAFADDNTRIHESSDDLYLEADDDIYISPDDDIWMDGSTLFVDGSVNRVGIGTSIPLDLLHIKGSGYIRLFVESTSSTGYAGVRVKTPQREYFSGINTDSDRWVVHDNIANRERLTVAANGRVGIGTDVPPTQLAVMGLTGAAYSYTLRYNPANGGIYYYISSEKYKEDIQPFEEDFHKILKTQPKSFIDKVSGERNIGYIAEEFDELGLGNLVIYNKDGQPDALKYELVSLYLLEVVKDQVETTKDQAERIEQLDAKNRSLKQRLDALEACVSKLTILKEGGL